MISISDMLENIFGKRENAGYQHFLPCSQCLQRPSFSWLLKTGLTAIYSDFYSRCSASLSVAMVSEGEVTSVCACQATTTPGGMMGPSRVGRLNKPQRPSTSLASTASRKNVSRFLFSS